MSTFTHLGLAQNVPQAALHDEWARGGNPSVDASPTSAHTGSGAGDAVDQRQALLARAIEHEIIPRLMLAHRNNDESLATPTLRRRVAARFDVENFAKMAMTRDTDVSQACVDTLRSQGVSVETIYLDLLAPVARYMGELWEEDLCDFTEVTIGLGRLHHVLRNLSPAFGQFVGQVGNGRRILLLPSPGEQHTFGLAMVSEFFRRAGWDVAGGPWEAGADPVVMVKHEWFDIVGFSLGVEVHLDELTECIQAVREAALNEHVGIMVGGPIFTRHPEYVARVGADCAASDGRQAPVLAEQLSDRLKKGC